MTVKKFQIYIDIRKEKDTDPIAFSTETSLFNEGYAGKNLKDFSRKIDVEIFNMLTSNAAKKYKQVTGSYITNEMKLHFNKIAFLYASIRPAEINDTITRDLELSEITKLTNEKTYVVFSTDSGFLSRKLSNLSAMLPFDFLTHRNDLHVHSTVNTYKSVPIKYRLYLNNRLIVERYFPILSDDKILVEEVDIDCKNLDSLEFFLQAENLEFSKVSVDEIDYRPFSNKFNLPLK